MADNDPRQRRPVGPDGRLMPNGRPWRKGQSGNPRGPVPKPRQVKDRVLVNFVQQLNSLMGLQMEIELLRGTLKLQGDMLDNILAMLMEHEAGTMSDADVMARAKEIAAREIERRRQQHADKE